MGEQVAARLYGGIAQLGEHLPCKQGVKGSNPFISTENMKYSILWMNHMAVLLNCKVIRNVPETVLLYLENRILNQKS